jgi:hypothetical protein
VDGSRERYNSGAMSVCGLDIVPLAKRIATGVWIRDSGENEYEVHGPSVGLASNTSLESEKCEAETHPVNKVIKHVVLNQCESRYLDVADMKAILNRSG